MEPHVDEHEEHCKDGPLHILLDDFIESESVESQRVCVPFDRREITPVAKLD